MRGNLILAYFLKTKTKPYVFNLFINVFDNRVPYVVAFTQYDYDQCWPAEEYVDNLRCAETRLKYSAPTDVSHCSPNQLISGKIFVEKTRQTYCRRR